MGRTGNIWVWAKHQWKRWMKHAAVVTTCLSVAGSVLIWTWNLSRKYAAREAYIDADRAWKTGSADDRRLIHEKIDKIVCQQADHVKENSKDFKDIEKLLNTMDGRLQVLLGGKAVAHGRSAPDDKAEE